MSEQRPEPIVPRQQTGLPIDVVESVTLQTDSDAQRLFQQARERLLDVNQWHTIAQGVSAHFQLTDPASGAPVAGPARKGLFFRISIPGPPNAAAAGFDWVEIEESLDQPNDQEPVCAFRVRPVAPPGQPATEAPAHFYDREATSTFLVRRNGLVVTAAVFDRNTKPNTDAPDLLAMTRDLIVGAGGVLAGSNLQWRSLVTGLLTLEKTA